MSSAWHFKSFTLTTVLGWELQNKGRRNRDSGSNLRQEDMAETRLVEMRRVKRRGQTRNRFGWLSQPDLLMDWVQGVRERGDKDGSYVFGLWCWASWKISAVLISRKVFFWFSSLGFWLSRSFSCFCLIIIGLTSAVSSGFSYLCALSLSLKSLLELYHECTLNLWFQP